MPMTLTQISAFAKITTEANAASESAMDAAWDRDEHIDGGSCGFAWVHFHDARHAFAKFVLATNGSRAYKHHKRGVCISISQGGRGQGMHIAEAGARAYCLVLRAAFPGVDIYDESRVD